MVAIEVDGCEKSEGRKSIDGGAHVGWCSQRCCCWVAGDAVVVEVRWPELRLSAIKFGSDDRHWLWIKIGKIIIKGNFR